MAGTIYRGERGTIQVNTLVLAGKGGLGDMSIVPPSGSSVLIAGARSLIENISAGASVSKGDSGRVIYSDAGGTITVTLAAASGIEGIKVTIAAGPSTTMRVDPNTNENIIYSGGAMSDGEYLDISAGGSLTLVSDGDGSWLAVVENGTLTEETP